MKNNCYLICLALILFFSKNGICQGVKHLSLKEKKRVIESLTGLLKENYVLQDSVAYIVPKLKKRYDSGGFKKNQNNEEFALYLTQELRSITKDAHFAFLYNPTLSELLSNPAEGNRDALNQQLNSIGGGKAGDAASFG